MTDYKTRHLWSIFLDPQFKEGVQAQVAIDIAAELQRLTLELDQLKAIATITHGTKVYGLAT